MHVNINESLYSKKKITTADAVVIEFIVIFSISRLIIQKKLRITISQLVVL